MAQQRDGDSLLQNATLENCIHYAIAHNPTLKNARLDEEITETSIKIRLADRLPQINLGYSVQHNFQLPTANFNGMIINTGSKNTSGFQLGGTQTIFSTDILFALRSRRDVRLQSKQNTTEQNINIAVLVSKAFYDVLLTRQQIEVTEQDIARKKA
jgi:outer membrane protein TolC